MAAKKKKTKSTALVTQNHAVALPFEFGEDAGVGVDLSLDDLLIPFVTLLQDLSDELDEDEDKFIEGVSAGQILNKATKIAIDADIDSEDAGMLLVPALKRRYFAEFLPDRGGFVGEHEPTSAVVRTALTSGAKKSELKTEAGNDLIETFSIYAIQLDANENPVGYIVVPFASSKIGAWRDYWTPIDTARVAGANDTVMKLTDAAPIFSYLIQLRAKFIKGAKGKYWNYVMTPARGGAVESVIPADHAGYVAAKALREAVAAGRAQADYSTERGGEDQGTKTEATDRHF